MGPSLQDAADILKKLCSAQNSWWLWSDNAHYSLSHPTKSSCHGSHEMAESLTIVGVYDNSLSVNAAPQYL